MTCRIRSLLFAMIAVFMAASIARAGFIGFGDFSQFTINQGDNSAGPSVSGDTIHITGLPPGEARSIFFDTPQNISTFTASFGYRSPKLVGLGSPAAAFVIENSPSGVHALGSADEYGYGNFPSLIPSSAAIALVGNPSGSGLYTGGNVSGNPPSVSPVNLVSGDLIDVSLSYNGSVLSEQLVDTVTSASFSTSYLVNLPSTVGGSTAYVGLTAGSGTAGGDQFFSDFQYASGAVPEPTTLLVMLPAVSGLLLVRRRHA